MHEEIKKGERVCPVFSPCEFPLQEPVPPLQPESAGVSRIYTEPGEDMTVCYEDPGRGICRTIVDAEGWFTDYPGVVGELFWLANADRENLQGHITKHASFPHSYGGFLVLWELEKNASAPCGTKIILYAFLDTQGKFTGPFRAYRVGKEYYYPVFREPEWETSQDHSLMRFHKAQEGTYPVALREIFCGRKRTHWIWYIFPQMKALARSRKAAYYGIEDEQEAREYCEDPVLFGRLLEISQALLKHTRSAFEIMGGTDCRKLQSSMTLFCQVSGSPVFRQVLDHFFDGKMDPETERLLRKGRVRY